jgi:hypothetical protein
MIHGRSGFGQMPCDRVLIAKFKVFEAWSCKIMSSLPASCAKNGFFLAVLKPAETAGEPPTTLDVSPRLEA